MFVSSSVSISAFVVEPLTSVSPFTVTVPLGIRVADHALEVAGEALEDRRVVRHLDRACAFPGNLGVAGQTKSRVVIVPVTVATPERRWRT